MIIDTRPREWMKQGDCVQLGSVAWNKLSRPQQRAKCRDCPVVIDCLIWVMRSEQPIFGITAGLNDRERRALVRRRRG